MAWGEQRVKNVTVGDRAVIHDSQYAETAVLRQHAIGDFWWVEFDNSSPYQFLRRVVKLYEAADAAGGDE